MNKLTLSNKQVSILLDAHVFDYEFQGSRTYLKELYKLLLSNSNYTFIFASQNISILKQEFGELPNLKYVKLQSKNSFIRLLLEYPLIIYRYKPNFAHFQYICPPIKLCKYILTTHDLLYFDYPAYFPAKDILLKKTLFRISLKLSDIITTVSTYSKESIIYHCKINSDRIGITPNGVSSIFFEEYVKSDSVFYIKNKFNVSKYILYVSRIEPRKQQTSILSVFLNNELYKRGYNLVFIGKRSIEDRELNNLISSIEPEILNHIFFFDKISENDLVYFYRAADLFVYPSIAEGFGIPPLEAGAARIPVVCSSLTAMSEFDFFEENHVSADNYEILQNAVLKNLVAPPDERTLRNISDIIKSKYTWKVASYTFMEMIRKNLGLLKR
jgi:glycosyltransferase involved in cell wall biosynthesis